MDNPLLADWDTPFGLPPFADIDDAHFEPAFDTALAAARADLDAIARDPEPPTFANTVEALERAGGRLDRLLRVFHHVAATDSNDARRALQRAFSPRIAAWHSERTMHPGLFARIDALWNARDTLGLTPEQARVLMLRRRSMLRAGAALDGDGRERLRDVMERLAVLGTRFTQNLLADESAWHMALSEADLEGLPPFVIDAAREAAAERGLDGHVLTTSRSLVVPFLQSSPRRDLRERAHAAWTSRGARGGETDNRVVAAEILRLREERARLLGYESFAAYKLETEMAGTPQRVRDLLMAVWRPAVRRARADAAALEDMLHADGVNEELAPWDWHYYAARRRAAEHGLDEAELKPYLQLDRMLDAAFECAGRLFGLAFRPLAVALHHPDARAFEVTRDGRHVAVFVGDWFARGSKRSGAWCSALRVQQRLDGDVRAVVVNVCNFAKPPPGQPALLGWDDARTLFHEFGHALHHVLSQVTHPSVAGTSVARDFVELPSQLFEHWLEVPEVLERHARHAHTGEPMPAALRERLLAAANADTGFQTVEYLASALVDLDFHDGPAPADPIAREGAVLDTIGMPRAIAMRHATPHFSHVFSGDGYSSGYYGYLWAEVMDADAFAAFEEAGDPFDPELAARLERDVLAAGGAVEAADLYVAFRGRMPGVDALLAGRGLQADGRAAG